MSRPLREIRQNVTYHCSSRCHNNRDLLKPEYVKKIVIQSLRRALSYYHFKLSYLEFVDNHLHIIVKTLDGGASISRIMQYIKSRIAEIFNRINKSTGAFWNERYKSEIIENSRYPIETLFRLIWYLSYHSAKSIQIKDPRKNALSSIHAYVLRNHISEIPLSRHEYFDMLGESFEERKNEFEKYEEEIIEQSGSYLCPLRISRITNFRN